jgi:putative endonuclease
VRIKSRGLFVDMDKSYQVYILQNPAGRFYIGLSEDVAIRVQQHNDGISKWTRSRGPWNLVWTSATMTLSEARKLENFLKKQKGGEGFYRLTGLEKTRWPSGS